jgi:hypothetical protein
MTLAHECSLMQSPTSASMRITTPHPHPMAICKPPHPPSGNFRGVKTLRFIVIRWLGLQGQRLFDNDADILWNSALTFPID